MKLGMTERHVDQSLFKACSRAGEIPPPPEILNSPGKSARANFSPGYYGFSPGSRGADVDSLGRAKFHHNRCTGVSTKKMENFHTLVNIRPAGANPVTDFYKF